MAELKFEEALDKLEAIVSDLESGEFSLDDSIKKYEEGMKFSKFCYKKLQDIQEKIEVLTKDSSGKLKARDFNAATVDKDEAPSAEGAKPALKKKRPRGEELLF